MKAQLGRGVYSLSEAARLTGLKYNRVREWFRGRLPGERRQPVFPGDYEPAGKDYAISFHDLIDLYVAGQLREHGVSLQTLRRVYDRLKTDLGTPHPFCRKELLTDGKTVFMRVLDDQSEEEMVEVLTRQRIFTLVLLPFLKTIDYDALSLARRWHIAHLVVLDPTICFGKPVVEHKGVPTSILAAAYHANNQNADLVSDWYNVLSDHVLAAVQFERNMAA
jgi:uncharacterized protein (DUF433 family)